MGRTGIDIIRQDGEQAVLMRCLVAICENRLSSHGVRISAPELEAVAGKRMVTIEGDVDGVVVRVMTAEAGAAEIERRRRLGAAAGLLSPTVTAGGQAEAVRTE